MKLITLTFTFLLFCFSGVLHAVGIDCSANHYSFNERPSLRMISNENDFYNWRTFLGFSNASIAKTPLAKRAPVEGPSSLVSFDLDDRAWQYDFLSTEWSQGGCGVYQKTSEQRKANNVYNFKYWQYTDISYYFGHKLLTIPPTMWTNAAHKNGVKSLGTFNLNEINPDTVLGQQELAKTINTLNEIATTLGFDGYLINYEGMKIFKYGLPLLMLMNELKRKGLTIIWYDAPTSGGFTNYLNELAVPYFLTAGYFQSNYWWKRYEGLPAKSYQTLVNHHLEKYKDNVFQSADAYRDPFKPSPLDQCQASTDNLYFSRFKDIYTDETLSAYFTGIGIYAPNWTMFGGQADPVGDTHIPSVKNFEQSDAAFWEGSGQYGCGQADFRQVGYFVKPRTVIVQLPFYSNFNTGVGESYFIKGALQSTGPWSNFTIQSILPTWQNVVTDQSRKDVSIHFDYENVYDGGSSLRIETSSRTRALAILKLFKTQFVAEKNIQVDLMVKSASNETIILIANQSKLAPTKVVNMQNQWQQLTFNVPDGTQVEELDLGIVPNKDGKISVNLGSIKLFDPARLPEPHNQVAQKNKTLLTWLPQNENSSYRIYGQGKNGSYTLLNEIVNSEYDLHGNIFNGDVDGTAFSSYLVQEVTVAGDCVALPL